MGTKSQMLRWLKSQVGHVGGEKYWQDAYGWSGGGLPFCAVGVTDSLKVTNTKAPYFPSKVAFDTRDKDVIGKRWVDRYDLQPLDILSFDWDHDGTGDHVGFVVERKGNGVYRTIEFNVSNMVDYRTRYAADIIGGIRPYYDDEVFTDVDESTPHYADIAWMKEAGIAVGYPDGTYRPGSALTRGDAAAFLHRLYNLVK